jgi:phage gp29-like protein
MRNIHVGKQSGMILPQVLDENGKEFFKFDIVNITGNKAHDISKIIQRYAYEILTALCADFLVLGQSGSGSFALSENKVTVSEAAIEAKLIEIQDQLNHDLIPQLFALNGWSTDIVPYFQYGSVEKTDLDVLSKFLQRCAATGLILKDKETVKWIHEQANMPFTIDEDMPHEEFLTMLTAYESGAGEGMEEGTSGNGTAKSSSKRDNSSSNKENA